MPSITHLSYISFHEAILILTAIETFLLCFLLNFLPNSNNQSRKLLVLFFLFTGGIISTTFVIWNPFLQTQALTSGTFFTATLSISTLLQGPILYFYFRSLSENINMWRWVHCLHFVPATTTVLIIILFNVNTYAWLPWNRALLTPDTLAALKFTWATLRCLPMVYVGACILAEYRFRQQLKHTRSNNNDAGEKLFLADIVLGGFLIIEIWSISGYLLGAYFTEEINTWAGMIADYFSTILVNIMFIYGITNTRKILLKGTIVEDKIPENTPSITAEQIFTIEKGIREERLYLERNLNLERFAARIGLKPRDVTVVLNTHYKVNFFEFINGHRIKEAMHLLSLNEDKDNKIMDIIHKSGFNSESTFVRYFKSTTGSTPSEYRDKLLNKPKRQEQKV